MNAARAAVIISVVGGLLVVVGICGGCLAELNLQMEWYRDERFQRDSAAGATANAVERIERRTRIVRPGEFLIAGALLLILARLCARPVQPPD